eukprot:12221498-Prorocentrum_lima.AAC.1
MGAPLEEGQQLTVVVRLMPPQRFQDREPACGLRARPFGCEAGAAQEVLPGLLLKVLIDHPVLPPPVLAQ